MAKTSGGVRSNNRSRANRPPIDVQGVKRGLLNYAKIDRWNRSNDYYLGVNDQAQTVIDRVAAGNYGFPSQVAQTVKKYNYRISEKQAYVIAKAAVDNEVSGLRGYDGNPNIIFRDYSEQRKRKKK